VPPFLITELERMQVAFALAEGVLLTSPSSMPISAPATCVRLLGSVGLECRARVVNPPTTLDQYLQQRAATHALKEPTA
jgi:hypothetical protein